MIELRKTSRIISTHDTEVKWLLNGAFVPKKGEIIIYDPDESYNYSRIKIGDGVTKISELPFAIEEGTAAFLNLQNGVCYLDGGEISSYKIM